MECKSMPFLYPISVLELELYPTSKTALILLLRDPADHLSLSPCTFAIMWRDKKRFRLKEHHQSIKGSRQIWEHSEPICPFSTVSLGQNRVINLSPLCSSTDLILVPYSHISILYNQYSRFFYFFGIHNLIIPHFNATIMTVANFPIDW